MMKRVLAFALVTAAAVQLAASERLAPGITFLGGPANGASIARNGKLLWVYGDPSGTCAAADWLLLTHARRDVTWTARGPLGAGAKVIVPAQEAQFFTEPAKFWEALREKRYHDYAQQTTKVPIDAIPVTRAVKDGEVIAWEGLAIQVLATPGYTPGAVTYLLTADGKRIAFTGDLLRDDGRLQDLFSLQDAIPEARIGGYHGWAGRLGDLVTSLGKVAGAKPDLVIPARGPILRDPQAAIGRLLARLRAVYANYLSIDALRWYFKDEHTLAKARRVLGPDARVDWMPMAATRPLPSWVQAISNSRLLRASDGAGFLVDCGGTGILDTLRRERDAGRLRSIDHVFVTHYHDDHTDALPALVREFGSQVHACGSLVDVLERPGDYRLPCLTKNPVTVTASHRDRGSWRWKEFQLTIFDFPGQTLHHNGLLVEQDGGETLFFAGDSFTPAGVDDYCLQNRNFLQEGQGFLRCLDIVQTLPPDTWLINQHVEPTFRFAPEQLTRMRETLRARRPLLADLLPYDDPNFGLDEGWAVLHPYAVAVAPGRTARLQLRITNHSPGERTFRAVIHPPEGFTTTRANPARIAARAEGAVEFDVAAPANAILGWSVLTADIAWDDGDLREWAEALVEVRPAE